MNIKNYLTHTKKYKELISAVHSLYRLINSTYELKDLVARLSRLLCQIFNSRSCLIIILDHTQQYSLYKYLFNKGKRYAEEGKVKIFNPIEKKIIRTGASLKKEKLLALPLVCEDVIGMIIIRRGKYDAPFAKFETEVLSTLAEQATIGIRNLQLYEEQQKIVLGSIKSLVTLLDIRVPQEYTHSPYFSRLAVSIAHQMRLDEKQVQSIKYAGLLHDAGKVDIPLEILTKTTKLTPQEYKIIKGHPLRGAEILRPLQTLRPVIPIIMHHHEKYDGTGYPSRLKKGQIPLGARIMAVADAFEAMVYGRPYRERMSISLALKEIKKKSGTQFDPKVVEAFLKIAKKLKMKHYISKQKK